jgi:hypothetical protein
MGFQILYDAEKQECLVYIPKTHQQIKQIYWKLEVTDEHGNTTIVQRKKQRKMRAAIGKE